VQSGGFNSPIRYGDALDMNPATAAAMNIEDGETVKVSSARGSVEMAVRFQPDIPEGLTFTTFHFPDLVDVNVMTSDAWDKRSGTAEFKAASIRIGFSGLRKLRPWRWHAARSAGSGRLLRRLHPTTGFAGGRSEASQE